MPEYSKIEDKRKLSRFLQKIVMCEERIILAERRTDSIKSIFYEVGAV